MTLDEYEQVMMGFTDVIAEWTGVDVEQRIEGNWMYLKFIKK